MLGGEISLIPKNNRNKLTKFDIENSSMIWFFILLFSGMAFAQDPVALSFIDKARRDWRRQKIETLDISSHTKEFIESTKRGQTEFVMNSATLTLEKLYWRSTGEFRRVENARRHLHDFWFGELTLESLPILFDLTEENLAIGHASVVGPFAKMAPEFYDLSLTENAQLNGKPVFGIRVKPRDRRIPLMDGMIYFSMVDSTLVGMETGFTSVVRTFPPSSDLRYEALWENSKIPKTIRWSESISIAWPFPFSAQYRIQTDLDTVLINTDIPSSTFRLKPIERSADAKFKDSTFWADSPIQLTPEEQVKFDRLGDLPWNLKILNPDMSSFMRDMTENTLHWGMKFSPDARYNRVEGTFIGGRVDLNDFSLTRRVASMQIKGKFGYGFLDRQAKYSAEFTKFFFDKTLYVGGRYYNDLFVKEYSNDASVLTNSIKSFVYRGDGYNYYYAKGYEAFAGLRLWKRLKIEGAYISRHDSSATQNAKFALTSALFKNFEPVYPINDGELRAIRVSASYQYGDGEGIFPRNIYWILDGSIEYSNNEFLKSDFHYTRESFSARFHYPTTRRGSFDGRIVLGFATDKLPRQYLFHLYGGTTPYVLKTVDFLETTPNHFQGNYLAAMTIEHNFGGEILEKTQLPFLKRGYVDWIPTFSVGYVNASRKTIDNLGNPSILYLKRPLYEAGFAIADIYRVLRIDLTWRLNQRSKGTRNFAATAAFFIMAF